MLTKLHWAVLLLFLSVFGAGTAGGSLVNSKSSNDTLDGKHFRISFPDLPSMILTAKNSDGSLSNCTINFDVLSLSEVINGSQGFTVLRSVDLHDPSIVWTETAESGLDKNGGFVKLLNFTGVLPNGAIFTVLEYYYQLEQTLFYPAINYTQVVQADSYKFTVSLSNWTFLPQTDYLSLSIHTLAQPYFLLGLQPITQNYPYYLTNQVAWGYYSIKDYFEAKLNFNNFVLIDGDDQVAQLDLVNDAIAPSYSSVEGLLITPGFDNTLYFPRFNKQALYDPDLTVLGPTTHTNGGDGHADGNMNVLLAEILVPVLTATAVASILIVVTVTLLAIFIHRRRKVALRSTINIDYHDFSTEERLLSDSM